MTAEFHGSLQELKKTLRKEALASRIRQADKDALSRDILARFLQLPEYSIAKTVLFYVHARSEVRTRDTLATELAGQKRIAIPYCVAGELELFHLQHLAELVIGSYGILEPRDELRSAEDKKIDVGDVDLFMVPGVAFDRRGARLGAGKGYYDKLLKRARPDATLVGLAFECQMFDKLPMEAHDVSMDRVITEAAIYPTVFL